MLGALSQQQVGEPAAGIVQHHGGRTGREQPLQHLVRALRGVRAVHADHFGRAAGGRGRDQRGDVG